MDLIRKKARGTLLGANSILAQNARNKMSDLGMIQEKLALHRSPEMFNRGCSAWIIPEKITFF